MVLDHAMLSEPGYVDYLSVMYGDRMTALTREDTQRAKEGYLTELADRAKNNQLRVGESVPNGEARSFSPGSVAATDVAEKMLAALLEKNPGMSVAIERPTPGSPLYDMATPLGPIFEVRAPAAGAAATATTPAEAEQSVRYWREAVERMQSAPQTDETLVTRRSMAEMAVSQANLLASRSLGGEAEQTFRSAIEIAPMAFEPAGELAKYLHESGRAGDAQKVLDEYLKRNPGREGEVDYLRSRLKAPKGQ